MAWDAAVVATLTDTPLFVVQNTVEVSGTHRWTTTKTMTATDVTDASFPTRRIKDRKWHVDSRPSGTASTWYLMMHADSTISADVFVISGHNFADVSGGVAVTLYTADSDNWLSNPHTIHSFGTISTDDRIVRIHGSNYFGLTRLALQFTASGNFIPQVSEVFMGPRLILSNAPKLPWDDDGPLVSDITRHKSKSGAITTYTRNTGQRVANLSYASDTSAETTKLRSIFSGTNYGAKSFVFIPKPSSEPTKTYFMVREPVSDLSLVGPIERSTAINMEETTPFLSSET